MYERAIQIVATNFAKTVMVSFILMLVIVNIVVRPLQYLEKSVSDKSFGKDRGQTIQLPKRFFGNPSDELNVLADRLEDSRQKLLKQLEEVQGEKNRVQSELDVERDRALKNQRLVEMAVLAAGIGHEILNPVTIISSHTRKVRKLIEARKMTLNDLNNAIAGVDKGLARITGIISGMKSLVRDGSNDPFQSVSIANIFDDVRSIVDNSIGKHGVDVTLVDGTDGCHIRCRSVQMGQVISGLVTNARDAIEKLSERWIRVESRIEGQNVVITITDSGNGIPPEVVQRLFVPFFTTKEPGKGTGLGLSIAKGIMDQHQGVIEVNQQSPNTQFVLKVPMAIKDEIAS
jgi:C4-dicarboxylate-specific signal transduction histidine kinase